MINKLNIPQNMEDIFDLVPDGRHSELYLKHDRATGLKAIVAINSYQLGPTLGGCRCVPYASTIDAIKDAILLSKAMTLKSAIAGVPFGGGKAVLIRNEEIKDRTAYFTAYGKFINDLEGKYITAVDSGTSLEDMDIVAKYTKYVSSTSAMDSSPAPYTSLGIYHGIRAAVKHKYNKDSLEGLHVSVQGVGAVGFPLCEMLAKDGVKLTVTDIDKNLLKACQDKLDVTVVDPKDIYAVDSDIFSPNALGATINDNTINQLKVDIIAGAANNQLENEKHGDILMQKNILFAPDFAINAGGLIYAANTYSGVPTPVIIKETEYIYTTLTEIFNHPKKDTLQPQAIANLVAEERLKKPRVSN